MIKKLINKISKKFEMDYYGGMIAGIFILGIFRIIFFPFYLFGDIYNHFKHKKENKENQNNFKFFENIPEQGKNKDRPVIKYRINNDKGSHGK